MKCARCGVENRETAKFCRDCGAKLEPASNMAAPVDTDQTVLLNSDDESVDTPKASAEQEQTVLLDTGDSAKDTPATEHVLQREASDRRPVESAANANICPVCGANTNPGAVFCRKCGCNLQEAAKNIEAEGDSGTENFAGNNAWKEASAFADSNASANKAGAEDWRKSVASYAQTQTQNNASGGPFVAPNGMNMTEDQLPERFRPLGAWAYFGWTFLFSIPIAGLIVAIVLAVKKDGNVNLRNFARSMFCVYVIIGILLLLTMGTAGCSMLGLGMM